MARLTPALKHYFRNDKGYQYAQNYLLQGLLARAGVFVERVRVHARRTGRPKLGKLSASIGRVFSAFRGW